MVPASFEESNAIIGPPDHISPDVLAPLSAFMGHDIYGTPVVITCWKLTEEEVEEFRRTGRVWLVAVGHTIPPVQLSTLSPFLKPGGNTNEN